MTTYTNGQFFSWGQKTSAAAPYTKGRGWTDIDSYYARIKFKTILNEIAPQMIAVVQYKRTGAARKPSGIIQTFGRMQIRQWGLNGLSGYAYMTSAPAIRVITIMTQPPRARIVSEFTTDQITGTFNFPSLAPGTYTVIDSTLDGSRQALVYDWVVVS
jgi:hypothetical protein